MCTARPPITHLFQRVTVKVTGTPVLLEPDVPVTVTFEVPAGVPVAGVPPPELVAGGESLLLQLMVPTTASAITPAAAMRSVRCESSPAP
ncbi:MAG: hypothetical protein NW703_16865 [Nitrospiraceae bacterium]